MNRLLFGLAALAGAALLFGESASAQQKTGKKLTQTPTQIEGPFYPDKLPADTDNDLIIVNDSKKRAKGVVTQLSGKVLGANGRPIQNAVVEIWQADGGGVYLHSDSHDRVKYDRNFQGFGRCITGPDGRYFFRTLKPVPYTFRTPHIHFIVKKNGKRLLTTQIYVKGHKLNSKDFILRQLRGPALESVLVDFTPVKGAKNEVTARFDIVLGTTPEVIDKD